MPILRTGAGSNSGTPIAPAALTFAPSKTYINGLAEMQYNGTFAATYATDPTSFKIYRSATNDFSTATLHDTLDGTLRTWDVGFLVADGGGLERYIWLTAVVGALESLPSDPVHVLAAPTITSAFTASPTTITVDSGATGTITWQTTTDDETFSANALATADGTMTVADSDLITGVEVSGTSGSDKTWFSEPFTPTWTPAALASNLTFFNIAAARAASRLWQDSGKTTLAAAATDPVYVMVDEKGFEWTTGNNAWRPLLANPSGSKWNMDLDGTNDFLSCATITKAELPVNASANTTWGAAASADTAGGTNLGTLLYLGNGTAYAPNYYNNVIGMNGSQKIHFNNYDGSEHGVASDTIAYGTGYSFIATRSSSNNRIYQDGTLIEGPVAAGDPTGIDAAAILIIGIVQNTFNFSFDGKCYGGAFFTSALSAGHIAKLNTWLRSLL